MEFATYLWEWITRFLSNDLLTFLNSGFVVALFASMAGAYFGATAAQKVILVSKKKEDLEKELRNINSAIMSSFTICNMGLTVKKQLVKPIYDQYIADQHRFGDFSMRLNSEKLNEGEGFHYEADLQDFDAPPFPIKSLNNILFNKINTDSRALSAVAFLDASLSGLNSMLSKRRLLIDRFKVNQMPNEQFAYYYFGIEHSGNVQKEYSDAISGIMSYINDVIFFSKIISDDLEEYGKKIRKTEKQIPSNYLIRHADFSSLEESGLMPDQANYISWLSGFKKQ